MNFSFSIGTLTVIVHNHRWMIAFFILVSTFRNKIWWFEACALAVLRSDLYRSLVQYNETLIVISLFVGRVYSVGAIRLILNNIAVIKVSSLLSGSHAINFIGNKFNRLGISYIQLNPNNIRLTTTNYWPKLPFNCRKVVFFCEFIAWKSNSLLGNSIPF